MSIPDQVRQADAAANPTGARHHAGWKRRLKIRVASWLLWAHVYVSMFSLAVVLFFSVTGITLNHPDWFLNDVERSARFEGVLHPPWVSGKAVTIADDPKVLVNELAVVEHLRAKHAIRGALASFTTDDYECQVSFKGPGYQADAFIDRETGRYQLTETAQGLVAILNDLHKGRDTGPVWSLVIDLSALLMTVVSVTGLGLLFYLKLRRRPGLVLLTIGALLTLLIVWKWVP